MTQSLMGFLWLQLKECSNVHELTVRAPLWGHNVPTTNDDQYLWLKYIIGFF